MAAPDQSRTLRVGVEPLPAEPNTMVLVISGPIDRAGIAALCQRVRILLEASDADQVFCDVAALVDPDAVTVDALIRLQLTARRLGRQVQLRHACGELQELLALMGLSDVVPLCAGLAIGPKREAEQREQPRGVEEEADPTDPIA